jgi:hypothetical protein
MSLERASRALPIRVAFASAILLLASQAAGGIAECGNVRLEDASDCELRGDLECSASCNELGIYKKACATKLHTVCREDCTLKADSPCTDECTERCSKDCDAGINVICTHNCFGECVGDCGAECNDAADPDQCVATCEATCDGECDIKCRPVVSASCYTHCIECCGGACTARANMDCQTTCQEKEFETCEYELKADCSGNCSGSGALFCDGEYVLAGSEIPACVTALAERIELEVDTHGSVSIDDVKAKASASGGSSCSLGPPSTGLSGAWAVLAALAAFVRRRVAPQRWSPSAGRVHRASRTLAFRPRAGRAVVSEARESGVRSRSAGSGGTNRRTRA